MLALNAYSAGLNWISADVGTPTLAGSVTANADGSMTIVGGGDDIWNASDNCHFYYAWASGKTWDAIVELDSLVGPDYWTKCELMVRASDPATGPTGPDAFIADMATQITILNDGVTAARNGVIDQFRTLRGGSADWKQVGTDPTPAYPATWMKVHRSTNVFSFYFFKTNAVCPNGWQPATSDWLHYIDIDTAANTLVGQDNGTTFGTPWPDVVAVGVAVTAHNNGDASGAIATIRNLSATFDGTPKAATATGPMAVFHLFDSPLKVTKPYESYMGCLTVPKRVSLAAAERSVLIDYRTPRRLVMEAIEGAYPGIRRENVHVWTLRGKSRVARLGKLWDEWKAVGAHLVEDGWKAPSGVEVFTDSGTYAPTFLVGSWKDGAGAPHVFLCDGYAATAEAMQAASLSEVLEVDATMSAFSPEFQLPCLEEGRAMQLDPAQADFAQKLAALFGAKEIELGKVQGYAEAIREARATNLPLVGRVLRADDLMPSKDWRVLASVGYMCDDPYTGVPGVTQVSDRVYKVTTRLATRDASSLITFTFRFMEPMDEARLVFSPLLSRFLAGVDPASRAVKVSDSGRVRNELQTMLSQALEHDGEKIRVHFDRIDEKVMPRDRQAAIRRVLEWYKANHPVWFAWLEIA